MCAGGGGGAHFLPSVDPGNPRGGKGASEDVATGYSLWTQSWSHPCCSTFNQNLTICLCFIRLLSIYSLPFYLDSFSPRRGHLLSIWDSTSSQATVFCLWSNCRWAATFPCILAPTSPGFPELCSTSSAFSSLLDPPASSPNQVCQACPCTLRTSESWPVKSIAPTAL